jgi:hypothetical protein
VSERFKIWRKDWNDDSPDEREAFDVCSAAEKQADYDHAHRSGWEWSWPVEYIVQDPNGNHFLVVVERHTVPEFEASKPRPL